MNLPLDMPQPILEENPEIKAIVNRFIFSFWASRFSPSSGQTLRE